MGTKLDYLKDDYAEWGYMEPSDFDDVSSIYVNEYEGGTNVIADGVLIDTILLVPGEGEYADDLPVVLAIPKVVNTWQSTYRVRAWDQDLVPEELWEFIEEEDTSDYARAEEEYRERVEAFLGRMLEQ